MAICPSCGKENPEGFAFCGFCSAPLVEQPVASAQEERKVVSVLFCDLVGFTAASEVADPEDVRARIRPYHARLREVVPVEEKTFLNEGGNLPDFAFVRRQHLRSLSRGSRSRSRRSVADDAAERA